MLVRTDLNPIYRAVQAGHAVAEYILRGPSTPWKNGTLIYLGVDNEEDLKRWGDKLDIHDIQWTGFNEPDIGNQLTAISCIDSGEIFKNLKLL